MDNTKFALQFLFFSYSFLLSGVLIYATILAFTELDAQYQVVDTIQEKVFGLLGITERPIIGCQNSTNQTSLNQTDTDNVTQNFAFKIDPEDYSDNENDYLEHVLLDEEEQEQEEELKSILNKIPQENKKNKENQGNRRKNNANESNTKKEHNKKNKHKNQIKTGSKKFINKKKLRRKKKVTKCSRCT